MKIRLGFVSNSSSSSFICDVCGEQVSGFDMCLSDAEMYECENGHTICQSSCAKGISDIESEIEEIGCEELLRKCFNDYIESRVDDTSEYVKSRIERYKEDLIRLNAGEIEEDEIQEYLDDSFELRYNLPSFLCPICKFEMLCDSDISKYTLKKLGQTRDDLKKEIREKFSSFKELQNYLKT